MSFQISSHDFKPNTSARDPTGVPRAAARCQIARRARAEKKRAGLLHSALYECTASAITVLAVQSGRISVHAAAARGTSITGTHCLIANAIWVKKNEIMK